MVASYAATASKECESMSSQQEPAAHEYNASSGTNTATKRPDRAPRLSLEPIPRIMAATFVSSATGMFLGVTHGSRTTALRFLAENAHRLPTTNTGWYLYHKSKNYAVMLGAGKEGVRMAAKLGFWAALFFGTEEVVDRGRRRIATRLFRGRNLLVDTEYDEELYHSSSLAKLDTRTAKGSGNDSIARDSSDAGAGIDKRRRKRRKSEENDDDYYYYNNARPPGDATASSSGRTDPLSTAAAGLVVAGAFSVVNKVPLNSAGRMCRLGLTGGLGFGILQDILAALQGQRLSYVDGITRLFTGSSAS